MEIVGLSYASLQGLSQLNAQGLYSFDSVEKIDGDTKIKWTLSEWAEKIKANFDNHYYTRKGNPVDKRPDLLNKEGIYKDTLNSGQPWTDYQLRCNFPIAMAVAPDLFPDPERAWRALEIAKEKLLGPMGIKTLDPDDWAYRGHYNNALECHDASVARGFNYHQGPEWVWPVGYFFRAYVSVAKQVGKFEEAKKFTMKVLSNHFVEVQNSHWRGIPELTNKDGEVCPDSNPIQAWSMACLLEVLHLLENIN